MNNLVFTNYPGHFMATLIAGAVIALSACSFRSATLRTMPVFRWVLGALNAMTILTLMVLIWNPSRVSLIDRKKQNTLLVCFDTSESMSVTESLSTRLDQAVALFDELFVRSLTDKPRCRWTAFDSGFRSISRTDLGRQWGSQSNLDAALAGLADQVKADHETGNTIGPGLCGVITFTDGQADNKQIESYVELLHQDCPVVIVGCGKDTSNKDVAVTTLKAPISVRTDQRYNIAAQVTSQQLSGQLIEVALWVNHILTDKKAVVMSDDNQPQDVNFSAFARAPVRTRSRS